MALGGPILVVREGGYDIDIGHRVLVAWKDSRESLQSASGCMASY